MKLFPDDALRHRKLLVALYALSTLLINVPLTEGSPRENALGIGIVEPAGASVPAGLEGAFKNVWIEHGVKVDGVNGMRIHAKFNVKNGRDVSCMMLAFFYTRDGEALRAGFDSRYTSAGGKVSAWTRFTPRYDSSEYADKKLFLPYSALNLKQSGVHDLKLFLVLRGQGKDFAQSAWYNFRLTKD